MYALLFGISFWIMLGFGVKEAQQRWLAEDKLERKNRVAEEHTRIAEDTARRLASEAEEREQQQLAEEHATYAPLDNRTPEEITETARRVAEKLKKA